MVDVERCVKTAEEELKITEEEKENFENFAMSLGTFMNEVWKLTDENKEK